MDLGLRERACIVTGASRGIGLATAEGLCAEGAHVLLVGRDGATLARAAERCRAAGGRAEGFAADITDPDAAEAVCRACQEAFGAVDVLVNSAGTSAVRRLEAVPDEEWQEQWELHVMAPMRLMRAAAPLMARRGWGRIVNVSSSSGKRPSSTLTAPYSVTKAAELSLSRVYAEAYAAQGVLINAVTPGPVAGELWLAPGGLADQQAGARGVTREQVLEATASRVPVGRMASDREVASVIVFLCGEPAGYVAGAAWSVDGGAVPIII
jgi:3-oxoacyl-[acyl-carrier protein] reductase